MKSQIHKIIAENNRRNNDIFADFDPITGLNSVGKRSHVSIPDFPIPDMWLPQPVIDSELTRLLIKHRGIKGFIENHLHEEDDEPTRDKVVDAFVRLRSRHDFPFWAATFVYISAKGGGEDVLFRLTYPQRRFVERLEALRLADKPIRLILLKARQWGGSTTSQLYMAWLQLIHQTGLNSLIVAHQNGGSETIKAMFKRMLDKYPVDMLYPPGEQINPAEPKLVGQGRSGLTQVVPQRNFSISVGSAQSPDSCRGGNYSLVHLSEVALFPTVEGGKKPEDIVRSACSGVLYRPGTMIVYESTANGVGNFFHREYMAAKDPDVKSQFQAMFVPWFDIELYRIPFKSVDEQTEFARRLYASRLQAETVSDREEPGAYLWWLWEKGASLEGIHWYVEERAKYHEHGSMASEYPSDDIEAFVNSGAHVFDRYRVEALRATCRPPRLTGEIAPSASATSGPATPGSATVPAASAPVPSPPSESRPCVPALRGGSNQVPTASRPSAATPGSRQKSLLQNLRFFPDPQGQLHIWNLPDPPDPAGREFVSDRYLAVVDIGGRSQSADWSVIVVFDRLPMIDGEPPAVVAQWRGHTDMDLLAWKAAQIAKFYDDALLVIESNTIETHERDRDVDGDQSATLLTQIKKAYPNLYARRQSQEAVLQGLPVKYGFHTNTNTKPMVISTLVQCIREAAYIERVSACIDEFLDYEKKQNGAFGAIEGRHDDMLMTRAIGLHICFHEMEPPRIRQKSGPRSNRPGRPAIASTI